MEDSDFRERRLTDTVRETRQTLWYQEFPWTCALTVFLNSQPYYIYHISYIFTSILYYYYYYYYYYRDRGRDGRREREMLYTLYIICRYRFIRGERGCEKLDSQLEMLWWVSFIIESTWDSIIIRHLLHRTDNIIMLYKLEQYICFYYSTATSHELNAL